MKSLSFSKRFPAGNNGICETGLLPSATIRRQFSDYTEPDHAGRRVDIHICGKYALKFWQDHADRHIKILHLHFADHARH